MEKCESLVSKHLWGTEIILCRVKTGKDKDGNILGYTGKELIVMPNGMASSIHYHVRKTETFCVERGILELEVFKRWLRDPKKKCAVELDFKTELVPGDTCTLYPLTPHRFSAQGAKIVIFKEFSTWDDPDDSIRLLLAGVRMKPPPVVKRRGRGK